MARMLASGVFSSCVTEETKSERIAVSATPARTARMRENQSERQRQRGGAGCEQRFVGALRRADERRIG